MATGPVAQALLLLPQAPLLLSQPLLLPQALLLLPQALLLLPQALRLLPQAPPLLPQALLLLPQALQLHKHGPQALLLMPQALVLLPRGSCSRRDGICHVHVARCRRGCSLRSSVGYRHVACRMWCRFHGHIFWAAPKVLQPQVVAPVTQADRYALGEFNIVCARLTKQICRLTKALFALTINELGQVERVPAVHALGRPRGSGRLSGWILSTCISEPSDGVGGSGLSSCWRRRCRRSGGPRRL